MSEAVAASSGNAKVGHRAYQVEPERLADAHNTFDVKFRGHFLPIPTHFLLNRSKKLPTESPYKNGDLQWNGWQATCPLHPNGAKYRLKPLLFLPLLVC